MVTIDGRYTTFVIVGKDVDITEQVTREAQRLFSRDQHKARALVAERNVDLLIARVMKCKCLADLAEMLAAGYGSDALSREVRAAVARVNSKATL